MHRQQPIRVHEDLVLFREALNYTSAESDFAARLIEKDYFCTVLLQLLAEAECGIIFRGGTCLAKVHAGFYRLSEDLDFVMPTPIGASRAERSRRATGPKTAVAAIGRQSAGLRLVTALAGSNRSTQYQAVVGYRSSLDGREEAIKIEIGLREPLCKPAVSGDARTLLRNPVSGLAMVPSLTLPCLSLAEAMAEKLRAALTRREAAIRDYYDIDFAIRRLGLDVKDQELVRLVSEKLAVPGNAPLDTSPARLAALRPQLGAQLKPVLRARDYEEFDLNRAFRAVAELEAALP